MKRKGLIIILIIMCVVFIQSSFFNSSNVVRGNIDHPEKIFSVITIEYGDTLWSIAKDNMDANYYTINTYIQEVKVINNLSTDKIIAGEYLIIPNLASNESNY
ncbi:LysM domain-containing protein [Natranaerovirga pectinivora]|uniref:LysM domain-containing protein n=1 Tax=Natranaerovirga pectinivora TaxID=682400 RepID=A0A4R3MK12_9FIRM|nr:LysM peptidoglycan-binding domain-containing protein [Natranaerovirga pectinivora]TCT14897.1 LysM domain-containing protein [Natranaerovirga pectinivora]